MLPNKKSIVVGRLDKRFTYQRNNVVGYWDFDNVRNDKVLDKSGNDNHQKN